MNTISDFSVDKSDDIIFINGDISIDYNSTKATLKNAKRRLSARMDDMIYTPDICAGIESFISQYISEITLSEIEHNIRFSLMNNNLFKNNEIKIFFDKSKNDKLGVIISFSAPGLSYSYTEDELTFSVYVDIQNQRSYS